LQLIYPMWSLASSFHLLLKSETLWIFVVCPSQILRFDVDYVQRNDVKSKFFTSGDLAVEYISLRILKTRKWEMVPVGKKCRVAVDVYA
jgi:hypothetical protein